MSRQGFFVGYENCPAKGLKIVPIIVAGLFSRELMCEREPVYFMAKEELKSYFKLFM